MMTKEILILLSGKRFEQERYQEAVAMYRGALKRGPKRLAALTGIKKSAVLMGDQALVEEISTELSKI